MKEDFQLKLYEFNFCHIVKYFFFFVSKKLNRSLVRFVWETDLRA
jgi:hypothetical protein